MTFVELRNANHKRHREWAKDADVPLSFRGLEFAGEAGELCNELKKLERSRLGMAGGRDSLGELTEELADVIVCIDLIAMDLGIDLEEAVREKFNKTSEKYGLVTRIPA